MSSIEVDGVLFKEHPLFSHYYASIDGRVFSSVSDKLVDGNPTGTKGYVQLCLKHEGNFVYYYKHRFIWECFHGIIETDREIDHINRCTYDNRLENLRLVSRRTNSYNKSTTKAVLVEELPEDVVDIDEFKGNNYEDYYFSPSTQKVYWNNTDDGEIVQLCIYANNQVVMWDTNGNKHMNSINTIRKMFG